MYGSTDSISVLAFSSDVHNKTDHKAEQRLGSWIDTIKSEYGKIDCMSFGGDMADSAVSMDEFWTLTQRDMDVIESKGVEAAYTTGNHEFDPGAWTPTKNATAAKYTLTDWAKEGDNYRIFCLGSESSTNTYPQSQIDTMVGKIEAVDNDKPIFIITHYPLHYYKQGYQSRTIGNANLVIDALNDAVTNGTPNDTSDDKKIVYLWGHNHTLQDQYYDGIYKPDDSIEYKSGSNKAIVSGKPSVS